MSDMPKGYGKKQKKPGARSIHGCNYDCSGNGSGQYGILISAAKERQLGRPLYDAAVTGCHSPSLFAATTLAAAASTILVIFFSLPSMPKVWIF